MHMIGFRVAPVSIAPMNRKPPALISAIFWSYSFQSHTVWIDCATLKAGYGNLGAYNLIQKATLSLTSKMNWPKCKVLFWNLILFLSHQMLHIITKRIECHNFRLKDFLLVSWTISSHWRITSMALQCITPCIPHHLNIVVQTCQT